jgi:hypothetical protein
MDGDEEKRLGYGVFLHGERGNIGVGERPAGEEAAQRRSQSSGGCGSGWRNLERGERIDNAVRTVDAGR